VFWQNHAVEGDPEKSASHPDAAAAAAGGGDFVNVIEIKADGWVSRLDTLIFLR
jgi:hypothetical protein